ncbi:hypothetical protein L208DRAFT_1290089, partial [Tricholoma matsutake]
TAKFLGVIINNKMNWKGQCTAALLRLSVAPFGSQKLDQTGPLNTISIAVPCMLYAADIFLTPQKKANQKPKTGISSQAIINKLVTIQRKTAIMITEAMRTMAMDTLNVMANLLLIHLLVDKHRQQAAL